MYNLRFNVKDTQFYFYKYWNAKFLPITNMEIDLFSIKIYSKFLNSIIFIIKN